MKVILADDHPLVLEGLERLLEGEHDVLGAAQDGRRLVELATEHRPDVLIADYNLPVLSGLEALLQLRSSSVGSQMVLLADGGHPEDAADAVRLGASGYVLREAPASEVLEALEAARNGDVWLSPAIARDVITLRRTGDKSHAETLTDRQREILRGLLRGEIAKEIASRMGISRKTVEYHKYLIMRRLGAKTTAELIQLVIRRGLVDPG